MVNILLADDQYVVRRGLREMLQVRSEWQVCGEASNGREAVKLARTLRPEIVILDLFLPELNGIETARQILHEKCRTEILLFADRIPDNLIKESLLVGVRGFVLKSAEGQTLLDAVMALSHRHPYFSGAVPETLLEIYLKRLGKLKEPSEVSILTSREQEIVQMIARGHSNQQAAALLDISVKTVETYRAAAMRKLGITSVVHLVHYAVRNQLIEV